MRTTVRPREFAPARIRESLALFFRQRNVLCLHWRHVLGRELLQRVVAQFG